MTKDGKYNLKICEEDIVRIGCIIASVAPKLDNFLQRNRQPKKVAEKALRQLTPRRTKTSKSPKMINKTLAVIFLAFKLSDIARDKIYTPPELGDEIAANFSPEPGISIDSMSMARFQREYYLTDSERTKALNLVTKLNIYSNIKDKYLLKKLLGPRAARKEGRLSDFKISEDATNLVQFLQKPGVINLIFLILSKSGYLEKLYTLIFTTMLYLFKDAPSERLYYILSAVSKDKISFQSFVKDVGKQREALSNLTDEQIEFAGQQLGIRFVSNEIMKDNVSRMIAILGLCRL